MGPIRIGVGGPVGAGKTQLVERITRALIDEVSMAAITNDIYTIEDAKILAANGVLPEERIVGIETGGCPHTAIREDTSMNDAAIKDLVERFPDLELIFVESGGDNLSATFSPELVDFSIYNLDVMVEDAKAFRKNKPFCLTNLRTDDGLDKVLEWIRHEVMMQDLQEA